MFFVVTNKLYAQVINDLTGTTLVVASSTGFEKMTKIEQAKKVGVLIAEKATAAGIQQEYLTVMVIFIMDAYRH